MIISKLAGGLGNQLFQYTVGRQLSLARNVPLILDLSFYENQDVRSFKLQHFNIQAEIATSVNRSGFLNLCTNQGALPSLYRKTQKFLPKKWRSYYKESKLWGYESSLLEASSPLYVKGFWQHHKYYEKIHPQIIKELTPTEVLDEEMQAVFSNLSNDTSSVSVHIRRGDYVSNPEAKFMGVLSIEYYQKAIDYVVNKIKDPTFYFFSDDLKWVQDNLKVHSAKYMDIGNGKKDYLELHLMSRCRHNIIANSTFSWWGAFLNQHPDKIVISPAQWVSDKKANDKIGIQFPEWIKL